MCGITGYVGTNADDALQRSMHAMAHRGPDDSGVFYDAATGVGLGHVRLAILELSQLGAQPMRTRDGALTLVYNGEIYNFRQLRQSLQKKGAVFRGDSDTEVLLALYREYGADALAQLNGIYAFAIWDSRDNSLFVARDPQGVKPFYYSNSNDVFAFASEIKALLCYPWVPRDIDPQAIAHYLRYLWCPAPRTPLTSVCKLQPGEAMVVRDGRIERRWQHAISDIAAPDHERSLSSWRTTLRQSLATAVQRQMVADVPVGAFLSGGLDSSAIVAYAREHTEGRLQCFTIDFDAALAEREGIVRDLPFARRVARQLDVDLHVVTADAQMADELERMVWQLDEPQADFAAANVLLISKLARVQGIKVLLSGAGGDDLFSGYRRHRALALEPLWQLTPATLRRLIANAGGRLPQRSPLLRRLGRLLHAADGDANARIAACFDWTATTRVSSLFRPGVAASLTDEPLIAALQAVPRTTTALQRMLLLEQRYFLTDHNLNYTDKMSMAVGVEVRVPFLDKQIVALAGQIPDRYKQRGNEGKWILKQALRGTLPDEVIFRPKTGFGVPLRTWLAGPLKTMMYDLLAKDLIERRGLFDAAAVLQLIREHDSGSGDHAYTLLALMCIELWQRRFIDCHQDYPIA